METHKEWLIKNTPKEKSDKKLRKDTLIEKSARSIGLSGITFYRLLFIRKYAKKLYDEERFSSNPKPLTPLYQKIKLELESFNVNCAECVLVKGNDKITHEDLIEIVNKYENLTFPFDNTFLKKGNHLLIDLEWV